MAVISNGTTIADAGAFSLSLGSMTLIKTLTASSSSDLQLVHGSSSVVLDGTYPVYMVKLINLHRADGSEQTMGINFSADSGSNYNVQKQTTIFDAYSRENGGSVGVNVVASQDLANGTGDQIITPEVELGTDNDASVCGELLLFSPSNTTFVKHFFYRGNHMSYYGTPWSINAFCALITCCIMLPLPKR